MAFVDTLLSEDANATVAMVDREHRPGGHWNHAYPFVRLHQPSAWYGVTSRELASGDKDQVGLNAGLYSMASGAEVLAHFEQVMQQRFLPLEDDLRWRSLVSVAHPVLELTARRGTRVAIGPHRAGIPRSRRTLMPTTKTPAKKAASTPTAAKTDATLLLTRDHTEVHKLFKQYEKLADVEAAASDRQALAEEICTKLTIHATSEEEIFYPAAREAGIESDLLDEAEVEHASAKDLIAQIRAMTPDESLYDAKVKVLGEYIDHHVKEEEEEMFPKCRKSAMDLAALAAQLADRKASLMAEASEATV